MVKVHLVIGFLGAGKTTFLKAILNRRKSEKERILIIVNDFGPENHDTQLLRQKGVEGGDYFGVYYSYIRKVN